MGRGFFILNEVKTNLMSMSVHKRSMMFASFLFLDMLMMFFVFLITKRRLCYFLIMLTRDTVTLNLLLELNKTTNCLSLTFYLENLIKHA